MKQVHYKINGIAHGGSIRICDVPDDVPIGEALRKADRMAFCHGDPTSSFGPATVAWDHVKGAAPGAGSPPSPSGPLRGDPPQAARTQH